MSEQTRAIAADLWFHTRKRVIETLTPLRTVLWENPVLARARNEKPISVMVLRFLIPVQAIVLAALTILAWAITARSLAAALTGLSLAPMLIAALIAPLAGAWMTGEIADSGSGELVNHLRSLPMVEACRGMMLRVLWVLRWLLVFGLATAPALMIGLLRTDASNFVVWRESALSLGEAAPVYATRWLLPDGSIPYFRLVIRAVSGGLLGWSLLMPLTALGVMASLAIRDRSLAPLLGLIAGLAFGAAGFFGWEFLTRTPLLAQGWEVVRVGLVVAFHVGLAALAEAIHQLNARLLVVARSAGARI